MPVSVLSITPNSRTGLAPVTVRLVQTGANVNGNQVKEIREVAKSEFVISFPLSLGTLAWLEIRRLALFFSC